MTARLLLPVLLGACAPDNTDAGTAVGNLDARMRVNTPVAADVSSFQGTAMVASVGVLGCDGEDQLIASDIDLALDGGSALLLPAGTWCGLGMAPSAPLVWEGTSAQGFSFSVTLDTGPLALRSPAGVSVADGMRLLWQLGAPQWLSAEVLGADEEDVVITPDDSEHDELVDLLRRGQRLFRDEDDDGRADDDDEELGEPEDEDEDPPESERDGRDNDRDGLVDEPEERDEDDHDDDDDRP